MKDHRLTAEPTHSVWNRDLPPRLVIESGDIVHMECDDASGGQVRPESTVEDFLAIDRSRIHALTGPIAVKGAEPGDVLEVKVLEVAHHGWAWTSVISGAWFPGRTIYRSLPLSVGAGRCVFEVPRTGHGAAATILRGHGSRASSKG